MSDNKEYLDWCDRWDLHGKASTEAFEDAKDCAAQPVVLTDEDKLFQIIRSFGYTTKGQTDEIVAAIIAAKEQANGN